MSVMGPPFSGSEHLDACASRTPPAIAALVSPPPPSTADASDAVTRSQVHPLDANCRSCEQQARLGSDFCSSALAASIVAQSALAYLAAYVLNESCSPPQGPERSWAPRREQVMESAVFFLVRGGALLLLLLVLWRDGGCGFWRVRGRGGWRGFEGQKREEEESRSGRAGFPSSPLGCEKKGKQQLSSRRALFLFGVKIQRWTGREEGEEEDEAEKARERVTAPLFASTQRRLLFLMRRRTRKAAAFSSRIAFSSSQILEDAIDSIGTLAARSER